jgi:molybdenum cofactor cytidylyltransferase
LISAIVLAAGPSTRMGFCKQLAIIKGKTMIEHVVDVALNSKVNEIILVLGFMAEKISEKFQDKPKLKIVFNRDYLAGLSSSVKAGVNAVSASSKAAVFLLGDQPLVKPSTINRLIEAYLETDRLLVVPTYRGRRGNPILIDRTLFNELRKVSGDLGGRILLAKYSKEVLEVEVEDSGILLDVDNVGDLKKARSLMFKEKPS